MFSVLQARIKSNEESKISKLLFGRVQKYVALCRPKLCSITFRRKSRLPRSARMHRTDKAAATTVLQNVTNPTPMRQRSGSHSLQAHRSTYYTQLLLSSIRETIEGPAADSAVPAVLLSEKRSMQSSTLPDASTAKPLDIEGLLDACLQCCTSFKPAQFSLDAHADTFLKERKISADTDRAFVRQVLYGTVRYQALLTCFVKAFYHKNRCTGGHQLCLYTLVKARADIHVPNAVAAC